MYQFKTGTQDVSNLKGELQKKGTQALSVNDTADQRSAKDGLSSKNDSQLTLEAKK